MSETVILGINRSFAEGMFALEQARQSGIVDAYAAGKIAGYINHIASRRVHVLAQGGNSVGNYAPGSLVLGGRMHTSPFCNRVEALIIAGRTSSNTDLGQVTLSVDSYSMPTMYVGGSVSGTSGPVDLSVLRKRMQSAANTDLAPDTDYDWRIETGSVPTAIAYFIIYEVPRETLDPAVDGNPAITPFAVGAPILDRDIASVTDTLWTIYKRSGLPMFAHSTYATSSPSATATFKNVLDATTTGYSSSAAGFWTIPYRKNRLTKTTLDVVLWAVANTDPLNPSTDGIVRFVNAAGTIGSITSIGTSASVIWTTTATIDATTSGSQLVIVEHSSATSTITTRGVGMLELI